MLPLDAIGVLGILYCFFMYGTLRATRVKRTVRPKARAKPAATDMAPETATQIPS
jgi:hypothetical protein